MSTPCQRTISSRKIHGQTDHHHVNIIKKFMDTNMYESALDLAQALLKRPSVTPSDADCQSLIANILKQHGFKTLSTFDGGTHNLLAWYRGGAGPTLGLAGHTDVVPPGDPTSWSLDPFGANIDATHLHGRGTIDMKGALACLVVAATTFVQATPVFPGTLKFLVTSDEEGDGTFGMRHLLATHADQIGHLDACLIGEPTSEHTLGDCIKIGRRGSIHGTLILHGIQGHTAYPELALNPIEIAARVIQRWQNKVWDQGNIDPFPATKWVCTGIQCDATAGNVIPQSVKMTFNIRHPANTTPDQLQERMTQDLNDHAVQHTWENWQPSAGGAFLSKPNHLSRALKQTIAKRCGIVPSMRADGGTSDGRFIHHVCSEVVEFGFCRGLAHHANERVALADMDQILQIYLETLTQFFNRSHHQPE